MLPQGVPPLSGQSTSGEMFTAGPGVNLEAIPKTGATIDSESGRPLAAMVAAGLGLSVVEILSDPGVTGARAVAETLDKPEVLEMGMRQEVWASVLKTICGYVIQQAALASQGPLRGSMQADDLGRERLVLEGDIEATIEVTFPAIDDLDPKSWVDALVAAESTGVLPPLWVVKQAAPRARRARRRRGAQGHARRAGQLHRPAHRRSGRRDREPARQAGGVTMARHVTVQVVVEPIETTGGHWCTRCLLPSGWLSWVTVRHADRMHLQAPRLVRRVRRPGHRRTERPLT
ncbi:hypothetical protein G5V59_02580 [Nocardioides sp. W3-2-3]|uniref:hypothetical protein n=1 Tax=Nocardioides convexus TaxID=2712224 RepID=UPI0024183DA3|nr:hypothetical protein [Nocardioides convexus]NGZ99639.1 hypothetical protein [Nocardioides convexus]